jgi:hypothetical protein
VDDGAARDASKAEVAVASVGHTVPKQDLKLWECAASLNFWLLFLVFGVGTGIGLMFVNNLGEPIPLNHLTAMSLPQHLAVAPSSHAHSHPLQLRNP